MSRCTFAAIAVAIAFVAPSAASGQVLDKIFKDWKPGEVIKSTLPHKFGATCLANITSRGSGPAGVILKDLTAKKLAQRHWEEAVTKLDGAQYANWTKAKGKTVTCEKKGSEFLCKASANPCA